MTESSPGSGFGDSRRRDSVLWKLKLVCELRAMARCPSVPPVASYFMGSPSHPASHWTGEGVVCKCRVSPPDFAPPLPPCWFMGKHIDTIVLNIFEKQPVGIAEHVIFKTRRHLA